MLCRFELENMIQVRKNKKEYTFNEYSTFDGFTVICFRRHKKYSPKAIIVIDKKRRSSTVAIFCSELIHKKVIPYNVAQILITSVKKAGCRNIYPNLEKWDIMDSNQITGPEISNVENFLIDYIDGCNRCVVSPSNK